jgi:hypothetical protein
MGDRELDCWCFQGIHEGWVIDLRYRMKERGNDWRRQSAEAASLEADRRLIDSFGIQTPSASTATSRTDSNAFPRHGANPRVSTTASADGLRDKPPCPRFVTRPDGRFFEPPGR